VVCRAMLRLHGGYECKEPDPGKFTLVGRLLHLHPRFHPRLALELKLRRTAFKPCFPL